MRARTMRRYSATLLVLLLFAAPAAAQTVQETILGRWDISIRTPAGTQPSWLEISKSGSRTLVGQFVGVVGSVRPISRIEVSGDTMRFAIPPQWEEGAGNLSVQGRLQGDQLAGSITFPDGKQFDWTASRAPALRARANPTWGEPIRLFSGTDLAGWHVVGGPNQWRAENGILRNTRSGGNLVTDRKFTDFKLRLEFRYPRGSNSGVYLRGRHEVQIVDSVGVEPTSDLLGAVYGFLPPSELAARKPGEWQSLEITLLGRMVTVVANGRTVICNREIPGITGGALDSNEGAPGPLMIQGDHGPIEFRTIVLTPAT